MDKRMKIVSLLIAALMIISLLTGCMATTIGVTFMDDGRVSLLTKQYLAESYFESQGTTPRQHFASELDKGKRLESVTLDGETYWGVGADPVEFGSARDFKSYLDNANSSVNVIYYNNDPNDGLYTVQVDFKVSPLKDFLAEGQEDFTPETKELLEKMVIAGTVHFPEGYFTISVNTLSYGEYSVDSERKTCSFYVHPSGKYEYTVSVFGYIRDDGSLSSNKKLTPLRNIWVTTGPDIKQGMSPERISWTIETNPGGALDEPTEVKWEVGSDGVNWQKMSENALFEAGKLYRASVSLDLGGVYEFTDDTVVGVNRTTVRPYMVYGDHLEFAYIFPPVVTDGARYVNTIDITLDEPREGLVIGNAGCSIKTSPDNSVAQSLPLLWFSAPNRAVDYRIADHSKTFDPELCYAYTMTLVPRAGFQFSENTAVRVNGEYISVFRLAPNFMSIDIEMDEVLPASGGGLSVITEPITVIPGVQIPDILMPNIPVFELPGGEGPTYYVVPADPEAGTDAQTAAADPAVSGQGVIGQKEETPFTDVPEDAYYSDAVAWAFNAEPQITDGNGKDKFMPEQLCTRGQVVTFLWRAMGCPEPGTKANPFADVDESDYFYKPVLWAVENGVTEGTTATTFSPAKTCTNAHILTFLYRAVGAGEDGWYEEALNWAGNNNIILGSFTGRYDVKADCPRKNVVYYLYRFADMDRD